MSRRAVAYAALGELIPLYPVYALLFADTGLGTGQIASLFVLWSLTSMVLEVPAGALADRVPRRHLLVAAGFVQAAGYALWVAAPGYAPFAAGFVLWGAAGALQSGTLEALAYEELAGLGAADRYGRLRAATGVAELAANVGATVAAAPLLALGGYPLVGWLSVGTSLVAAAIARTLPLGRPSSAHAPAGYVTVLRAGLREAAAHRPVRRLVLLTALLAGLMAVDEYAPLLLRAGGAAQVVVPILVALLPMAAAAGTWLAGRVSAAAPVSVAVAVGASALLAGTGAVTGGIAAVAGAAVWYGVLHLALVITDVRLQEAIAGPARATVTSVAGLGSEVAAIAVFAGYGATLPVAPIWAVLLLGVSMPTALLTVAASRWLPVAGRPAGGAAGPPDGMARPDTGPGGRKERVQ